MTQLNALTKLWALEVESPEENKHFTLPNLSDEEIIQGEF